MVLVRRGIEATDTKNEHLRNKGDDKLFRRSDTEFGQGQGHTTGVIMVYRRPF